MSGFERRLAALFLLLSVPPTLFIAFVSTRYFVQSVQLVSNPGVAQSFSNSMEIAREFSSKLEDHAGCTALRLADQYDRGGAPGPSDGLGDLLAGVSRETHADFAAIYTLEGQHWRLVALHPVGFPRIGSLIAVNAVAAAGAPADPADPTDPADLADPARASAAAAEGAAKVDFADPDIIAAGLRRGQVLFVAGFALEQGFAEKMRGTADDLGRYRAVNLYASARRRYIIMVTSVLVLAVVVASAAFSRLVARRISHPITELAHATERVAKGDLDHRVVVPARDEILSLVDGFNKMTSELKENKANLIRAERIAAWRDVARRIAHEIKNPLTPIEIAIYRIKKRLENGSAAIPGQGTQPGQASREDQSGQPAPPGQAGPPDAAALKDRAVIEESLDSILKEVAALKAIAQEFSAFAKLPEPRPERLNINDTVKSLLELYSAQRVEVRTDLAEALPEVLADRDQMRSVIANLIKNALEAMPAGGTLTVTTGLAGAGAEGAAGRDAAGVPDASGSAGTGGTLRSPSTVRIQVADTGAGIPEEIRGKIFDPFFTTKATGSGIGLAVAYRILADHHARITFTTGDTGTTFVVDLPVAPERA